MSVPLIMIIAASAGALGLAMLARRGRDTDLEEWSVAGRSFGSGFVFLLMAGEIFTTATFLGTSGYTYSLGAAALYIPGYACLAYVISFWLLPPVWRYAKEHRLVSATELFEHLYRSRAVGVVAGLVAVVALVPYLAGQLQGLGLVVASTAGHGVTASEAMAAGTVLVCLYVLLAGIRGPAWAAIAKDLLTLGIVLFLGIFLPFHYFGGYSAMFRVIAARHAALLRLAPGGLLSPLWFSTTVLLSGLGFYLWPHTLGAALTARHERTFRTNAALLPLYSVVLLLVLFVGFAAFVKVPGLGDPDLALLRLSAITFPGWVLGLVSVAVLLAALVPGSVIMVAAATTVSAGFFRTWRPDSSPARLALLARVTVPVAGLVAFFVADGSGRAVITLLLLGYGLVSQLFPGLICALVPGRLLTPTGMICGVVTGVGLVAGLSIATSAVSASSTLGNAFPGLGSPWRSMNLGLAAMVANVLVAFTVSLAVRRRRQPARTTAPARASETRAA